MKKEVIFFVLLSVLAINLVSAGTYNLEFNQVDDKIVVKESINNTQNKSYVDEDSLNFAGKEIYFLSKVIFPENFEIAVVRFNLEEGVIIKNKEIFPLGYKIETDGQIISVLWSLNNVKKGENFAIFVNLENTKKANLYYFFIVLGLVVLAIGVWFLFFKRRREVIKKSAHKKGKTNRVKEKESEKYDYLLDTEKKIIEELKNANRNELWQRQIQTSAGFSKAKVSRLIKNLESRGLITKIPFGNTNKIRLK